jgi:hypothetical protein
LYIPFIAGHCCSLSGVLGRFSFSYSLKSQNGSGGEEMRFVIARHAELLRAERNGLKELRSGRKITFLV